jgi:hypothetical protein
MNFGNFEAGLTSETKNVAEILAPSEDPQAAVETDRLLPFDGLGFGERLDSAYFGGSRPFTDRLALTGGLLWERLSYDDAFGRRADPLAPTAGVEAMTFDFGADVSLDADLTLGASFTLRKVDELTAGLSSREPSLLSGRRRNPTGSSWIGQAGLEYADRQRDLTVGLVGFVGSRASAEEGGSLDVQGLELNAKRRLLDGKLTIMAAAMLNYFNDGRVLLSPSPIRGLGSGSLNLSSYLGLAYRDPSILNANFFLRYAEGGDYLRRELIRSVGPSILFDARLWRDWTLSPALTLSTQLYGSSPGDYSSLYSTTGQDSPYLESRVTMSYSF